MGTGVLQHGSEQPPNGRPTSKLCHSCGSSNSTSQSFCGSCGSPLSLEDFIAKRVSENVATAIRDRNVLETESSIRVFERAWGWVKIVGTIAAALLVLVGAGVTWKVSDWWRAVDSAKIAVTETANTARQQIHSSSTVSLNSIRKASTAAQKAGLQASANVKEQSQ